MSVEMETRMHAPAHPTPCPPHRENMSETEAEQVAQQHVVYDQTDDGELMQVGLSASLLVIFLCLCLCTRCIRGSVAQLTHSSV